MQENANIAQMSDEMQVEKVIARTDNSLDLSECDFNAVALSFDWTELFLDMTRSR